MKNMFTLYSTYTAQTGQDDCGSACVSMLLKYCGRAVEADLLSLFHQPPSGGHSLLDLRNMATHYGLQAQCVVMDHETLVRLNSPTVLHTKNSSGEHHFVVCYYARKRRSGIQFLIGDPASGLVWFDKEELDRVWTGGAALYLKHLPHQRSRLTDSLLYYFFNAISQQCMLLISIPFLNICATLLGISLSWLLQLGIKDPLSDRKGSLLFATVALLFVIMAARNAGNFLRQRMLLRLNADIRKKYITAFIKTLGTGNRNALDIRKGLMDVQRIQNATTACVAVVFADGSLILLLVSGLWYFEPVAGMINTVYIAVIVITALVRSAGMLRQRSFLSDLSAENENNIMEIAAARPATDALLSVQQHGEERFSASSGSVARSLSLHGFLYESAGTLAVILVLSFCLVMVREGEISYNVLMTEVIISYVITVLLPRICHTFPDIIEGALLVRKFGKLN